MWHPHSKFPDHLKLASNEDRLLYFEKEVFLNHEIVSRTYEWLFERFINYSGGNAALIIGPTGVGKTGLSGKLLESFYKNVDISRGCASSLPMIYVTADVQSGKLFSWKSFYCELLVAMGEVRNIRIYGDSKVDGVDGGREYSCQNRSEYCLKKDVLSRAKDYGVKYILIDEIQHIFKYGGNSGEKNMDILKSMSDTGGFRFIGLGTYETSFSLAFNGQISRRYEKIDFPAYSLKRQGDIEAFGAAYVGLLAHLPIELDPEVINFTKSAFLGACGCVGILKEWLERALSLALKDERQLLGIGHLEKVRLSNRQLKAIAEEIREGEAFFEDPKDDELWDILGRSAELEKTQGARRAPSSQPGRRLPARDKVGVL